MNYYLRHVCKCRATAQKQRSWLVGDNFGFQFSCRDDIVPHPNALKSDLLLKVSIKRSEAWKFIWTYTNFQNCTTSNIGICRTFGQCVPHWSRGVWHKQHCMSLFWPQATHPVHTVQAFKYDNSTGIMHKRECCIDTALDPSLDQRYRINKLFAYIQ